MSVSDLGSILIPCGHCSRMTSTQVLVGYEDRREEVVHTNTKRTMVIEVTSTYTLSRCPACRNLNLAVSDLEEDTAQVLWPGGEKSLVGLPPKVDSAYKAALSVKNIGSNAFGVLIRRLLEMVCIDRAAQGRVLNDQLRDLVTKGEIPERLANMAQQLRQLGNIGAHAGAGDLTTAEVPFLDELCRAILEYLYVAPQTIARVQERLDALKGQL